MTNFKLMHVRQSLEYLLNDVSRFLLIRYVPFLSFFSNEFFQVASFGPLLYQMHVLVVQVTLIQFYDVWVVGLEHDLDFVFQTFDVVFNC